MGGVYMRDSVVWGNHAPAAGGEVWVQPGGLLEILCSDVDTTGVDGGPYDLVDTSLQGVIEDVGAAAGPPGA